MAVVSRDLLRCFATASPLDGGRAISDRAIVVLANGQKTSATNRPTSNRKKKLALVLDIYQSPADLVSSPKRFVLFIHTSSTEQPNSTYYFTHALNVCPAFPTTPKSKPNRTQNVGYLPRKGDIAHKLRLQIHTTSSSYQCANRAAEAVLPCGRMYGCWKTVTD